jgi:hypothetical protein
MSTNAITLLDDGRDMPLTDAQARRLMEMGLITPYEDDDSFFHLYGMETTWADVDAALA